MRIKGFDQDPKSRSLLVQTYIFSSLAQTGAIEMTKLDKHSSQIDFYAVLAILGQPQLLCKASWKKQILTVFHRAVNSN